MGLGNSKQEPIQKIEDLTLQHHLINYISKSFCIRNLVSRQRRRMLISGFDLDMSYITDRLLAMSFPAERMRAMFRNPLWQVKFVLDVVHEEHYKASNTSVKFKPSLYIIVTFRLITKFGGIFADLQSLYRGELRPVSFPWSRRGISFRRQPCPASRNDQTFLRKCALMALISR